MTCTPSPFPKAVLAEASRISPRRRTSSDGICGDAAHQAQGSASDHNPDSRGIPHAVDISQSMPGAPFWLPTYGLFDAHGYGEQIAQRMHAGTETRVKYLVSHNYATGKAKVCEPDRPWHDQDGDDHASHLHVSFTVAAEDSTTPFFVASSPVPRPGGAKVLIVAHPTNPHAYWCINAAGQVYAYGGARYWPEVQQVHFNGPVTGAAATSTGNGLYLITQPGSVYALGDAVRSGDPAGNPAT